MPNYTGTQSNLTGIPSALPSSLQQIQDPNAQTAIYQLQQWANSFFPWQYGEASGTYITGGITVTFDAPYSTAVRAISFGPAGVVIGVNITSTSVDGFTARLYGSGGAEITNGTPYVFFYMAIGN